MRGMALVAGLMEGCLKTGGSFVSEARGRSLIVEDGRVSGIRAEQDGGEVEYRARLGVILASGGFEWNRDLWNAFIGVPWDDPTTPPSNRGDGLIMAASLGAELANLDKATWISTRYLGEAYDGQPYMRGRGTGNRPGEIMVNRQGVGFVSETLPYNDIGRVMMRFNPHTYEFENHPCYVIGETRCWEVAVLREGPGSRYIHDTISIGQVLAVQGPRNHFPLLPGPRYIFIAGGIGITPFRPMLAQVSAAAAYWQLLYGGRSRSSMAFLDEFTVRYGSRLDTWALDERGLIDLRVLDQPIDDKLVYCCGPESLLQAVEKRCSTWLPGSLRVERFRPKEPDTAIRQDTFEVTLARSGQTVLVPPGRSILMCVREAGLDVASSCEESICGTCETRVLEGEVDHRDSILTAEERAANDTMMICCSRAFSDRLVLDL